MEPLIYWLRNGRERMPYKGFHLKWYGWASAGKYRTGTRKTSEATFFADVAAILRETPAQQVTLHGVLSYSKRMLAMVERRSGEITGPNAYPSLFTGKP